MSAALRGPTNQKLKIGLLFLWKVRKLFIICACGWFMHFYPIVFKEITYKKKSKICFHHLTSWNVMIWGQNGPVKIMAQPSKGNDKKMIDTSIYSNLSWPWPLRKGVFGAFSPIHIYVPWMSSSLNDYVWFSWPRFTNTENLLGPSFIGRPHCQTVHKVIGRRKSVEPGVNLKCRIDRSSNIDVFNATRNDLIYVRTFIPFHLSQDIFI